MICQQCGRPYKQDTGFYPDCNCANMVTVEVESIQLVTVLKELDQLRYDLASAEKVLEAVKTIDARMSQYMSEGGSWVMELAQVLTDQHDKGRAK